MIEYVQFFPTLRCNNSCEFCFSRQLNYSKDFPEEKIEHLIKTMLQNNIYKLDILGGEPFLYPHLCRLIDKATKNDMEVTISSNGTLIEEIDSFLNRFKDRKVKIGISINDTPNKAMLELIEKHKLWIKTVVTKNKFPERSLLEFAKNHGIKYYLIYMDALTERDMLESMPFYEFMEKISGIKVLYPDVEAVFCKGFIGGNEYRCPAGLEKITLMPDGSVYPCYLLAGLKEYKLGNIFESALKQFLSSELLNIFRNFEGNICNNKICYFYNECKGGCIAHSIIHYGRNNKSDPRCRKEER